MIPIFLQGASLGLSAASLPGPFQAFLFGQTLSLGWRRTIGVIFAPLLSDGPIILAFMWLLAQVPGWFLGGIQVLGGILLLYLAIEAFRAFRREPQEVPPAELSDHGTLFKAVLINATGPGPYLFWGLVGAPILINSWKSDPLHSLAFLVGFYLTLIGSFGGLVIIFALARRTGPKFSRVLIGISGFLLLFFSAQMVYQGVLRLGLL